ncbi:MAG: hypothetical protein ACI4VF_10145 [Lachnospirales bacterium]
MVYEFVGAKSAKFTTEDGKVVPYAKICVKVPFPDEPYGLDAWIGSNWDVLKLPYDKFNLVDGLEEGDRIDVAFDRNGKVDIINLV